MACSLCYSVPNWPQQRGPLLSVATFIAMENELVTVGNLWWHVLLVVPPSAIAEESYYQEYLSLYV